MSTDFRDESDRDFEAAGILLTQSREADADHLFGLAAECSLRAIMLALDISVNADGAQADRGQRA